MAERLLSKNLTIAEILEAINRRHQGRIALQIKNEDGSFRRLSYEDLGRRAVDVSSTLIKLGIVKDERVAILSESRPEWAVAFFGAISAAAIVVPIDVKLTEKEVQFILNDSRAVCIFVSKKCLGLLDNLKFVLPYLKHIILLDESERDGIIQLKGLRLKEGEEKNRPVYAQDTVLIVYTSGTTGVAKGVMLSYENLLFQVSALSGVICYSNSDRLLSILPLNHMLEMTGGLILPLYSGACITYASTLKASELIGLMKETHTTFMIAVPLVLKMFYDGIMRKAERMDNLKRKSFYALFSFSKAMLKLNIRMGRRLFAALHDEFGGNLKCFVSGGAPLNTDLEVGFNALGFRLLQGYGLTETAPVISVNSYRHNKFGSVGRPLPGVEVKIKKDNPNAQSGEIVTRGPHVMRGYFQNQEKTREILKDGWLHTGDIGYLDRSGFLHISGRARNLIVLGGGKKVFPEEVEEVIGKSPYIKEICVLSRSAERGMRKGTEEVYAVIVPQLEAFDKSQRGDKEKIKEKISGEILNLGRDLAEYKRISGFELYFDELPKTATKKLRRSLISEIAAAKK
ncbi:MAG: hypothetical protein COV72_03855 [Candidatus Omnitrophica bacterium CG11_big_fil_rev_8_21_14_0_20_42_13]|uniref:AMP-dependent synthetase/ligase domain-containing protein n=1 Tax=Candidatus Ghiorseimicrobium undicola TaxID=1974746 RepID=A0A2H0LY30_9BACT|nr:MAG: hypothetical protein COV72_03855 [Candidatus Omnitrophica bacterium CG11_big_fil_rev_8_21_14_0_20_42_13]